MKLICLNPDCHKPNDVDEGLTEFTCKDCGSLNSATCMDIYDGVDGFLSIKVAVEDSILIFGPCDNPDCRASHLTAIPPVELEDKSKGVELPSDAHEEPTKTTCPECNSGKRVLQRFQY